MRLLDAYNIPAPHNLSRLNSQSFNITSPRPLNQSSSQSATISTRHSNQSSPQSSTVPTSRHWNQSGSRSSIFPFPLHSNRSGSQLSLSQSSDDNSSEDSDPTIKPLDLVEMYPKLARRFHEPILLLFSLNQAFRKNLNSAPVDAPVSEGQSAESNFRCFVNKLAQLCDRERGGTTVTAFVVLQFPDRIQYRFAANELRKADIRDTKTFITEVLEYLGKADIRAKQATISVLLRKSLVFNRPRIAAYLRSLRENVSRCLSACDREKSDDCECIRISSCPMLTLEVASLISNELKGFKKLLVFSEDKELAETKFSIFCEDLIYAIDKLHRSEVDELIRDRTNEGKINESVFWSEFRHSTGRLLSYLAAVKALILARKRWPELFEWFEVTGVPSSIPTEGPFRTQQKRQGMTMNDIIGRMTSNQKDMKDYRARAECLEKFEINSIIQKKANFRPLVHAEVLLLDSLLKDGGTHESRFFNHYRYIGSSKPTCRLCDYYFFFHPSNVAVRETHRNVYIKWRMPDIYPGMDVNAKRQMTQLMDKILQRIRDDAFRTLVEKTPQGKPHDSNTSPTWQNSESVGGFSLAIRSSRSVVGDQKAPQGDFDDSDTEPSWQDSESAGGVSLYHSAD